MARFTAEPFAERLDQRLLAPRSGGLVLYWLGQAGFVVDSPTHRILIDPYLSDSLARRYAGTDCPHDRMMPPPVTLDGLGRIDLVLVTHHHADSMDPATLAPLARNQPHLSVVVPAASLAEARSRTEIAGGRLIPLDAGDVVETLAGVTVRAVRGAHETLERDEAGRHVFLGYCLTIGGLTIFHSGDTVPFDGQVEEVAGLGVDCGLLPVNGRSEARRAAGFAGNMTLDEALALARAAGFGAMIAHHHGMFAFDTVAPAEIDGVAISAGFPVERARLHVAFRLERE
jgi:L-ascorbate metabolism protein UlaG (beta-lactamase superfamily)